MLKENVRKNTKIMCLIGALLLLLIILVIFTEVTRVQNNEFNWWLSVFLPLVIVSIIATLISLYLSEKEQNKYILALNSKERKINELQKLNFATNEVLITAQLSITAHELWKARAIKCNPEIERIVCQSFAKDEADKFQKNHPGIDNLTASYINYSAFIEVLAAYHNLSDEAKSFVSLNMETIRQKLRESLVDYINFARNKLNQANSTFQGTPEYLHDITQIINWYEGIPATVKNKIPSTLITGLMMKKANAEYETAILNGNKEDEELQKANTPFSDLNSKLFKLWTSFKNWNKEKFHVFCNFLTRNFGDEYKDELTDEEDDTDPKENSGEN